MSFNDAIAAADIAIYEHLGDDAVLHLPGGDKPVRVLQDDPLSPSEDVDGFELDRDGAIIECDPADITKAHQGIELTLNSTLYLIDHVGVVRGKSKVRLLLC